MTPLASSFARSCREICRWSCLSLSLSLLTSKPLLCAGPGFAPTTSTTASVGPSSTDRTKTNQAPVGWFLSGTDPASYRTGVDRATNHGGRPSAFLASTLPVAGGFGTLMQSIDATAYAGRRVRLRASVQSQDVDGWAGMWMRVDHGKAVRAFDNMENRAIKGTHAWQTCDVVLDVASDATSISFGILLSGTGQVWLNHVTLDPVGEETGGTGQIPVPQPLSTHPVNTDFSQ